MPPGTVDAFITNLEHPNKDVFERLRAMLLAADERVTESIKWKVPTFGLNGQDRITFHLRAKTGAALILHRGAKPKDVADFKFADEDGLLVWLAPDRAILTLQDLNALETKADAVAHLLKRWMIETSEK